MNIRTQFLAQEVSALVGRQMRNSNSGAATEGDTANVDQGRSHDLHDRSYAGGLSEKGMLAEL